ncbi:rhomboid family intramembrane serine protease [Metabacillus indicus]|uniref:rhomboid family intramembrane serine protease n=1 Tax=Metabacillus indicus TaxID=246786 RepID=UPI003CF6755E
MGMRQEQIFWKYVHDAVTRHNDQIIRLSDDDREVLLAPNKNKEFQLIRILQIDLDWGSQLQQDIERTAFRIDRLREQTFKHPVQLLNIYLSPYPPVDDWEHRTERPHQEGKTTIKSVVIHKDNEQQMIDYLEALLGKRLPFLEEEEESEISLLKKEAIFHSNKKANEERQLFRYGKPLFTYLFIGLQVGMFMLLEASGGSQNPQTLVDYGAKYNPLLAEGEWWRLFTPIILHIGILHLLMNTLALLYIGGAVERMYGSVRFLLIYLFAGASGTLASFAFSPSISAGASGAIFGCFGALLYMGIAKPKLFFRTIGTNVIFIIVLNLLFGFAFPGVDNAGHLGGLAGGFLAALMVQLPKQKKWGMRLTGAVLALFFTGGLYLYGSLLINGL